VGRVINIENCKKYARHDSRTRAGCRGAERGAAKESGFPAGCATIIAARYRYRRPPVSKSLRMKLRFHF